MLRPWTIVLSHRIDPARSTPLYLQVVHALIHEIQRGRLAPGTFLPSSRELARTLSVNRKTIVLAYDDLVAQGWLEARGTRGTIVATTLPEQPVAARGDVRPAECPDFPFPSQADAPFVLSGTNWLTIDEGTPDCRLFPVETLARAYRDAIIRARRWNRLRYGDPRGSLSLRECIADMLTAQRGMVTTPDHICITRGSQMGIALAAGVMVRPGDTVLMERLSYRPAADAFVTAGARVVGVPVDDGGIDVAAVEAACRRHRVRAVYLTPHHHFPTTVALRPERRLRLLDLARQFGFALIEDDYDHDYHFETQPLLPIAAYAPRQVVYVGSLSKLTLPTLRIGYIVAPASVVNALAARIMETDRQGNILTEEAVAELIEAGELRRHARKTNLVYAERRDAFAATLRAAMGDMCDFEIPDGGLALWLRFRDPRVLDRIDAHAAAAELRLAPSTSYAIDGSGERGLRLGFASLEPAEAARAIGRLAAIANATR